MVFLAVTGRLSLSGQRLDEVCDHVVRLCSRWSSTRAAATIVPIFHGQKLMLRSALKVVLRIALPRSPTARRPLWTFVEHFLKTGQLAAGELLVSHGDGAGLAVAQVTEHPPVPVALRPQQRQHLSMFAQRGGVMLASGPDRRGPQRPSVRVGDDLDVPTVLSGG